jgi:23S rRNA (guanine745-N1)-methyltransferase
MRTPVDRGTPCGPYGDAVTTAGPRGRALADAAPLLRCPVCAAELEVHGDALGCGSGHRFDVARQGYVNLLGGDARPGTADTPAMVAAREAFLDRGHYAPLAQAVAAAVPASASCVVDLGAGTGYYLRWALDAAPSAVGLALDISKHAARRAARAHPRAAALVADAWAALPVRDGVASVVLSVFAPRNADEIARVLSPDGLLIVAAPTPRHLAGLVGPLGLVTVDGRKGERLDQQLGGAFVLADTAVVSSALHLSHEEVLALVGMGPSARHLSGEELARRVAGLDAPVSVELAVTVSAYRLR